MSQSKTESATPKKLREARKRGEVPRSRELPAVGALAVGVIVLAMTSGGIVGAFTDSFALALGSIEGTSSAGPVEVLMASAYRALIALAPFFAAIALAAGVLGFLQVGPLLSLSAVSPKLERLDPIRGAKNLFHQRQAIELIKTTLKLLIVGILMATVIGDAVGGIAHLPGRDPTAVLATVGTVTWTLSIRVAAAMAFVAILDVLYQRWRYHQDQRMTKEEVKREHRESEGDPHAKQQRARAHREILAHSMLEEVRRADVLVVNPTHFAVALRYDREGSDEAAPEVRAKGQDELAQRMIQAAREAGVPVLRDVPLARALFELEIGEEIPEALYEAVAIVLTAAWAESEDEDGAP